MARQSHVAFISAGGILLIGFLFLVGCSSREERFAEKIEQANENLEKGEVQKAIKILEKLKVENPDKPQILENLAFAFIQDEDFFTGAFYFNQLAQSFSENSDYYLYAAQAWIKAGDLESAIRDYEAYLLENRTDWNTWQKIGDLYLETNQTSKAIHAYSNSSQIRFNPELDLKSALLANQSGNLRQAEAGFERLLIVESTEIAQQAHVGLLQIKHKRRQWEEVEKLIGEIESRFPSSLDSAAVQEVKKDFDQFNEAKLAEVKKIEEEEERRRRLLEEQRERAERLVAARQAALEQATAEEEETPEVVPPSELAIQEEASDEEEIPDQVTTTPDPTPPPVVEQVEEKSPFQKALESARQIASTNSEVAVARYWDAINIGDPSGTAFYELARLYYKRGQFTEAEMTSLESLRRAPSSNRFLMTYLQIIRKTKPKPDVVQEIQKYRREYPQNPNLVLLLARIYAEPDGDPAAAKSLYNLFFEMAPNHPDIERARYEARGI